MEHWKRTLELKLTAGGVENYAWAGIYDEADSHEGEMNAGVA